MLPSEEIKEKINVVDLVGETVQLKKAGANYRGLCPFHHEKTASFMVSPAKQIWHCFGCGLGGDIFEFVKQTEGVEFPEALEMLAARAGITIKRSGVSFQPDLKKSLFEINQWAALFYSKVLAESPAAATAREYVSKRGFKPETVKQWQIGYAPDDFHAFENFITKKGYTKTEAVKAGLLIERNEASPQGRGISYFDRFHARVMFPLFDLHGRVVGFTARVLERSPSTPLRQGYGGQTGSGNITAKYINSPETPIYSKSRLIYGLHLAKNIVRQKNEVVVVEGNVDVITCHEAGFGNVVGSSGTALTDLQLDLLKRFTVNISFAFDVDEAGLLATRRAVEMALAQGFNVKVIAIPKQLAKDPDELIRKDPSLWEQRVTAAQAYLDFYFEAIFAKIDIQSNTGKKQAVAEILPLLSLLPETLDRVHYAQKLALQIGVDEKIIIDLVNKQLQARNKTNTDKKAVSPARQIVKSNQEILETKVLALLIKFVESLRQEWQNFTPEDFSTPNIREIFVNLSPRVAGSDFELEHFLTENPKFAQDIELLLFALENEISLNPDLNVDDLKKQTLSAFRLQRLKRQMSEIAMDIKRAEQVGRAEEVKILSSRFNILIQELSKYHV